MLSHDDFELESYDCPNLQGSFKRQKNGRWSADYSPTSDISNQTKSPNLEESETESEAESEARKEKAESETESEADIIDKLSFINRPSAVKSPKKTEENQSSERGLLPKRVNVQYTESEANIIDKLSFVNRPSAVKSPKKTNENQSSDHGLLPKKVTVQLVMVPGGARAVVHGIQGVDLTPKQRSNVKEQIRTLIKAQEMAKSAGTVPPTKSQMLLYD